MAALLDQIAGTIEVDADDLLLKAVGSALASAGLAEAVVVWRYEGAERDLGSLDGLTLGQIARRRRNAPARNGAAAPITLTVSRLREDGIRPVAVSLDEASSMRLTVSGARDAAFECLLTVDEAVVDETRAAAMLGALRNGLAVPLRLLV